MTSAIDLNIRTSCCIEEDFKLEIETIGRLSAEVIKKIRWEVGPFLNIELDFFSKPVKSPR